MTGLTPYAGTSGWSGSSTSEDRAVTEDGNGTTRRRQQQVLELAVARGTHGVTVAEARTILDLHHGQASGALSVLHKEGVLLRLTETRHRCKVYVAHDFVAGRETESSGRTRGSQQAIEAERQRILDALAEATDGGRVWIGFRLMEQIVNNTI